MDGVVIIVYKRSIRI